MSKARSQIDKVNSLSKIIEDFTKSRNVFILFVDLCDSTAFKQFCLENEIPDTTWILRQQTFLSRTAQLIKDYEGSLVKTIGDEIMATFPTEADPKNILLCCLETCNLFNGLKSYNKGKFKIKLKAAIDVGPCYDGCIIDNQIFDPIGTCVDRCARIAKFANTNTVVFSKSFFEILKERNPDSVYNEIESLSENLKGLGNVEFFRMELS